MTRDDSDPLDGVVLDTSALLYWTLAPDRLTPRAKRDIDVAKNVEVLSVSLWEIALKHRKGALELPGTIDEYQKRLLTVERLHIRSLDASLAVAGALLDWTHRDPADRWITALAMRREAPLITSDRTIRD
nr:type II toxin-antitoxin system VapC family toxin [Spirochaeta sp.]